MTPKELLFASLRHENVPRCPWVPFAGVHAGKLIGADATQVLTDEDMLFNALMEVNRLYRPDGQPVVFDLQLEAEILGCELVWAKEAPPSVKTHPLEDTMTVPCRCTIPKATDGRLPIVLNVMRRMRKAVGDTTALYGLICGPFTLASHLRGNNIFMDMYDDGEYVSELLDYCKDVSLRMAQLYIEAGMDVVAVVDPLVSQISAQHFEEFLSQPFGGLFAAIRAQGVFSAFFVCGDATRNIEAMCLTKPDCICIDENVDLIAAKAITDRYDIALGGNIPLTTVMLHGTHLQNMRYVVDILDRVGSNKNLIIAPGCDMPYAVPADNAIAVAQAVRQTQSVREALKNYVAVQENMHVDLPDYANVSKPLVEAFTLDSATCAACAYMWNAVTKAKEQLGDAIDVEEYKFTQKENIARCVKLGVQHLPSIYINGELAFSSLIPGREELSAAIEKAALRIKERDTR